MKTTRVSKLGVRVVNEKTLEPIKDARVFICGCEEKEVKDEIVYMNTLTDDDGKTELSIKTLTDKYIFILVKNENKEFDVLEEERYAVIRKGKTINLEFLLKEENVPVIAYNIPFKTRPENTYIVINKEKPNNSLWNRFINFFKKQ